MPLILRNAIQLWQDHANVVQQAMQRMEKLTEDGLNARSQLGAAINSLENAAPTDPFSWLGDEVFRPDNPERRQGALRRFRETKNLAIEYHTLLQRVRQKLNLMLNIARHNVRFLTLVQSNLRLICDCHILRDGLGVDLSFGGIKLGAWLVGAGAGVAFTVAMSLALSTAFASITLVCPVIVAALAVVAFLIGGIIAGEIRKGAFEDCHAKANEAYSALSSAKEQCRRAEEVIDEHFQSMREALHRLGSNVGPSPEDVEREMYTLHWTMQMLAGILARYRRDVARGRPSAADDAVADMAADIPDINFSDNEKRQLLTVDTILEQAGDRAIDDVRALIQHQGAVMTDRVHAFVRLAVADVQAHNDEGSTEAGDDEDSTEMGDDEGWEELIAQTSQD